MNIPIDTELAPELLSSPRYDGSLAETRAATWPDDGMLDAHTIRASIGVISARFAQERRARQLRRALVQADFDQLRNAGFLLAVVPVAPGR